MTKTTVTAGDVNILGNVIEIHDFTKSKKLNIKNLIRSFDIFASIHNHTLTADFYINDGIELLNNFPVRGEEYITLSIETPGSDVTRYFEFFVESIHGVRSNDMGNQKSYMLRCVTKDSFLNAKSLYSHRYSSDEEYSNAVDKTIGRFLGSEKNIVKENTKGFFDFMVNRVRPFQAIDLICERAISASNKSSLFYFFERYDSNYYFSTLEKMIESARIHTLTQVTNVRSFDVNEQMNMDVILNFEVLNQGDSVSKVQRGTIRNKVFEFDIRTGEYWKNYEFDRQSLAYTAMQSTLAAGDMNTSAYLSEAASKPAISSIVVKDSTRPENFHNENIHWKRPYEDLIRQFGARIKFYGNTKIDLCDIVQLNIYDNSGSDEKELQKMYSSKYLITELRNRFDKRDNGGFEHFMVAKLNTMKV